MKKQILLLLLSVFLFMTGCAAPHSTPLDFEKDGFHVVLSKDFKEAETSDYFAVYEAKDMTVSVQYETADFSEENSAFGLGTSVVEYALSRAYAEELAESDGLYYADYETEEDGQRYQNRAYFYKNGYDFWTVEFCIYKAAENTEALMNQFAKSVTFTSHHGPQDKQVFVRGLNMTLNDDFIYIDGGGDAGYESEYMMMLVSCYSGEDLGDPDAFASQTAEEFANFHAGNLAMDNSVSVGEVMQAGDAAFYEYAASAAEGVLVCRICFYKDAENLWIVTFGAENEISVHQDALMMQILDSVYFTEQIAADPAVENGKLFSHGQSHVTLPDSFMSMDMDGETVYYDNNLSIVEPVYWSYGLFENLGLHRESTEAEFAAWYCGVACEVVYEETSRDGLNCFKFVTKTSDMDRTNYLYVFKHSEGFWTIHFSNFDHLTGDLSEQFHTYAKTICFEGQ